MTVHTFCTILDTSIRYTKMLFGFLARNFSLPKRLSLSNSLQSSAIRLYVSYGTSKERKRFYKQATVCESSSGGSFEINLDSRKLKTPGGALFQVDSALLAQMIAQEWQSQTSTIKLHTMHLSSLMNTCLDNPNKVDTRSLVANINDYLQTDTLLYFDANSIEKLDRLQEIHWRPLVDWFNAQFPDLKLTIKKSLDGDLFSSSPSPSPDSSDLSMSSFDKYLERNFSLSTLIAFNYLVECLKSVILTVALLERRVESVDECVRLSLLEQIHQYDQWGKVEWHHDVNEEEIKARVSAALLFIYLSNDSKYLIKRSVKQLDRKNNQNQQPYP
jgi:ATP synthase F1 complex assembly factor 2